MSRLPDGINLRLDTYLMVSNAVSVDNKWHIPNITDHSVTYICNSFDVKNWSHRCTIAANVAEHADLHQIANFRYFEISGVDRLFKLGACTGRESSVRLRCRSKKSTSGGGVTAAVALFPVSW